MPGYSLILKIRSIEDKIHNLGFRWGHPRHQRPGGEPDHLSIMPRDDELPVYARDAELFTGTIAELEVWLRGVEWARDYDMMMKVVPKGKRRLREQGYRHQHMLELLKHKHVET